MLLEICASNFKSALNAQSAGAQRIELCQELAVGGITPSYGLLAHVLKHITIPIFVLIRPRSGNFTYSNEEFEIMKRDIECAKKLGVAGIVSGVLLKDGSLDIARTQKLVELTKPLPFTFHRAFDWVPEPLITMQQLITIGVDRILTSGQEPSAEKGLDLLFKLKNESKGDIGILPGGGINSKNAKKFADAGFDEIHASATKVETKIEDPKITMNSEKFLDDSIECYSDLHIIKQLISAIA